MQQILKEPYFDADMVTDELVDVPPTAPLPPADRGAHPLRPGSDFFFLQVLLTPLLQPGSADVVFDTLSYSAAPLHKRQPWRRR